MQRNAKMPTLPKISVSSLKAVKLGSLVSLKYGMDRKVFGFRVSTSGEPEDPQEPALAVLLPTEGGIVASLAPNEGDGTGPVAISSTRVTDYGNGYSIHVRANNWDGQLKLRTFATTEAGLLIIGEGEDLGLIVSIPWAGGCEFLNLKTWVLGRSGGNSKYVAAKKWTLSLPWIGEDVDWPLDQ
jgi:hypothetical protein